MVSGLVGIASIGHKNIKAEWESIKEEHPLLMRVRNIYEAADIDFENPREKDLDDALHIAKMVERARGRCYSEFESDREVAAYLFLVVNSSQLIYKGLDYKESIDFADFAEKCIKLCDENGLSYCPDEAPKAEGDGPETELIAD